MEQHASELLFVVLSRIVVVVCCVDFSQVRLQLAKRMYLSLKEFTDDVLRVFREASSIGTTYSDVRQLEQWFLQQVNCIEL